MINGYIVLDLNSSNVYAQAKVCASSKKPVLVNYNNESYYVDSVVLSGTDVVIKIGNKTFTISSAGAINTTGTINGELYLHSLYCLKEGDSTDDIILLNVINGSVTAITDIADALPEGKDVSCIGIITNATHTGTPYAIHKTTVEDTVTVTVDYSYNNSGTITADEYDVELTVTDTVTKLL